MGLMACADVARRCSRFFGDSSTGPWGSSFAFAGSSTAQQMSNLAGLEEFGSSCNFMSFGLCVIPSYSRAGIGIRGLSPESTTGESACSTRYVHFCLVYVLIFINMFMQINVKYPNCQNLCSIMSVQGGYFFQKPRSLPVIVTVLLVIAFFAADCRFCRRRRPPAGLSAPQSVPRLACARFSIGG